MKNLPLIIKYVLLLSCLLLNLLTQAQNIHTIDVEKSTDAAPRNNMFTSLDMYAELNGIFILMPMMAYMAQLWRTDSTAAGTWLIKDINLGLAASNPDDIVVSGNKIFFVATDGLNGRELWYDVSLAWIVAGYVLIALAAALQRTDAAITTAGTKPQPEADLAQQV